MTLAGSRQILAPPHRLAVAMRDADFLRPLGVETAGADEAGAELMIGRSPVHFAMQGDALGTQLAYEADIEDAGGLKAEIDRFLDRLQAEIAGPKETAAAGPLVNAARVMGGGGPRVPGLILGMPLVFWGGTAIFAFLFVMMFSGYL